jgi:hypothetical protein
MSADEEAPMRKRNTLLLLPLIFLLIAGSGAAAEGNPSRWESNLSVGYIKYEPLLDPPQGGTDDVNQSIGIVKSFWFYPFLPRIVAVGLSFDYVIVDLPLSANVAVNLPLRFVVPFVSAGTGFSFSGSKLRNYGGGIKLRLGKRIGLIGEYRHYRSDKKSFPMGIEESGARVVRESNYFGAGIAYLY